MRTRDRRHRGDRHAIFSTAIRRGQARAGARSSRSPTSPGARIALSRSADPPRVLRGTPTRVGRARASDRTSSSRPRRRRSSGTRRGVAGRRRRRPDDVGRARWPIRRCFAALAARPPQRAGRPRPRPVRARSARSMCSAAARIGGLDEVELRTTKPPRALQGRPVSRRACGGRRRVTEPTVVFDGPASEAVVGFPGKSQRRRRAQPCRHRARSNARRARRRSGRRAKRRTRSRRAAPSGAPPSPREPADARQPEDEPARAAERARTLAAAVAAGAASGAERRPATPRDVSHDARASLHRSSKSVAALLAAEQQDPRRAGSAISVAAMRAEGPDRPAARPAATRATPGRASRDRAG